MKLHYIRQGKDHFDYTSLICISPFCINRHTNEGYCTYSKQCINLNDAYAHNKQFHVVIVDHIFLCFIFFKAENAAASTDGIEEMKESGPPSLNAVNDNIDGMLHKPCL